MATLVVDNFRGPLTRVESGDINSGFAKYDTSFGYNPFTKPGDLTWFEQPTSIISDIVGGAMAAARVRSETGTTYVYTVTNDMKLRKIQVNSLGSPNPNLDSPSILSTLSQQPTSSTLAMNYGGSMQFYGTTEKIFVGTDFGVTKVNFTGAGEASIATTQSSVMFNVPRPSAQFLGKMYFGNGNNLIEIDSTETVTSYAKLDPSFPAGTYVRDLDVTQDGNYLQITVSRNNSPPLFTTNVTTNNSSQSDSFKFFWNGTDEGYTASENFPGYSLTANAIFGPNNYTLGSDLGGCAIYQSNQKIVTLDKASTPNFHATYSNSNLLGFVTPEYVSSVAHLQASGMVYGQYDVEMPNGLFRLFRQPPRATGTSEDTFSVPVVVPVTNLLYTYEEANYPGNIANVGKIYFSVSDFGDSSTAYTTYRFLTTPFGTGTPINGVYETQTQIFSKKVKPSQVRVYAEPWVANNAFKIDLVGSNNSSIIGASKLFEVGNSSTIAAGNDYAWYTPAPAPTYAIGIRITNLGTSNFTIKKVEVDYDGAGK